MKNIKKWQLKTCIFMDMDEFDEIGVWICYRN